MGANLKAEVLTRAARSVTALASMRHSTRNQVSQVAQLPIAHDQMRMTFIVVSVLQSEEVLVVKAGQNHSRFPRISAHPLHHLKRKS